VAKPLRREVAAIRCPWPRGALSNKKKKKVQSSSLKMLEKEDFFLFVLFNSSKCYKNVETLTLLLTFLEK